MDEIWVSFNSGIGAGFIPKNLDIKIIDETLSISNNSAFSRELAKCEGIQGEYQLAAIAAAIEIHERKEMQNLSSVIIVPSFAESIYQLNFLMNLDA